MRDVLHTALNEIGTKEIVGAQHNDAVIEYAHEVGHDWVQDDETPWCAAFVGAMLKRTGYEHSGKLNARSYEKLGWSPVEPQLGDVVVLWRGKPDGWQGHVGFFVRRTAGKIYILGGNQKNEVNISAYSDERLLAIRRLRKL